jgi:hypothetical protein
MHGMSPFKILDSQRGNVNGGCVQLFQRALQPATAFRRREQSNVSIPAKLRCAVEDARLASNQEALDVV